MHTPRFLLATICVATIFLAPLRGQGEIRARWEGEINVVMVVPAQGNVSGPLARGPVRIPHPRATGELTSTWTFNFSMREARRVDVKDADGTLVGQIVVLNNVEIQPGGRMVPGTLRWSGQATGTETTPCTVDDGGCPPDWVGPWTYGYSGDVSGTTTGGSGFIYYSMAAQDPMRELLANGTYALTPGLVPQIKMIETITAPPRVRPRAPRTIYTSMPPATFNGFHTIGAWDVASVLTAAQQPPRGPLTVAQLRAALKKPARGVDDPANRTIANDAMADSFVVHEPMGDTLPDWSYTWTESWNLHRRLDITSTLTRTPYEWRPKLNDTVTLTASLDPAQRLTGKFRFTLFDVSKEKGYAMNAGTETGADLKFADGQTGFAPATQTSDGWQIETTSSAATADVKVQALDYGAWGHLKAEVNVNGEWYPCAPPGGDAITIPRDDDGNRIADVWESNFGVSGQPADSDTDDDPHTATKGDGFTNFEEYRGFMVKGTWLEMMPDTKQLFMYDQLAQGIGFFGKTGIYVYGIDETEYQDRVMNFNRGYATRGPQRGIWVHDGPLDVGVMGETRPIVGVPNNIEEVVVDLAKHTAAGGGVDMSALMDTIAHELGHAVAIPHHGPYEKGTCGGTPNDLVALWHGAHAGDLSCVMRYDGANQYKDSAGTCHPFVWPLVHGNDFCETNAGTGINAGPSRVDNGQPVPVSGDGASGGCKTLAKLVN